MSQQNNQANVISEYMPSNYNSALPNTITGMYFKLKRDTAAGWANIKVPPMQGEPCAELLPDGRIRFKIGDGIHTFNYLPYAICGVDDGELT